MPQASRVCSALILPALMPELIKMYNSGNFAVESKIVYFVALNKKVENH